MYRLAAERYGAAPAFAQRRARGSFKPVSYRDLYEFGLCLGSALIELGVEAREHLGLLSDSRVEWNIVDYATLMCGAADVPRGSDVTDIEIEQILNHADCRVVFVEDLRLLKRAIRLMPKLEGVERLILMRRDEEPPDGVLSLYSLVARGKELRLSGDRRVEQRMAQIRPDDLFTLIYTSGTTGTPKGVRLTHANMASQVRNLPFRLEPDDRMLSILPVWHSYERIFQMVSLSNGCCTYFTSIRTLADDLRTVKPTMMASAPRLWENLYLRIMKNVRESHWIRRALFHAAYFCSRRVQGSWAFLRGEAEDLEGRALASKIVRCAWAAIELCVFLPPYVALDAVVLEKLRLIVGGSFKGTVSGGGALQRHVDEFFNFIGVPVREGYGLTETSPVLAVRADGKRVIGTVGSLYPETRLRILDLNSDEVLYPDPERRGEGRGLKGEVVVKGPQVMDGYHKDPEATSKVLADGWLRTGDIGMYTYNDCLKLLGRRKETIVLLNGENLEPVPIEAKLAQSDLIEQCMVIGQDRRQLGALVVPSLDGFAEIGLQARDLPELLQAETLQQHLIAEAKRLVSAANGFKAFERVSLIAPVRKPFEVGDELTGTFKLRRHVIVEKYAEQIGALFSD